MMRETSNIILGAFWVIFCLGACAKKPSSELYGRPCLPSVASSQRNPISLRTALSQCPRALPPGIAKGAGVQYVKTNRGLFKASQICQANQFMSQVESTVAQSHRVVMRPLPGVDYSKKLSLGQVAASDGYGFYPLGPEKRVTLEYCQRKDPKVMNTTGGSCMAMSWYWALAHLKDDLALGILEQESLKNAKNQAIRFDLDRSEVFNFFNILRAGLTEGINQVQMDIESSNNKLFMLLRRAESAKESNDHTRAKILAEQIVSLRNDQISFLKMLPLEPNPSFREAAYNYLHPSHNQYPDLKIYPIADKADFNKVFSDIQQAIKVKVEGQPQNEANFPLTGRKTGLYIFHLIGDGTAHAMGLKYTYLPNLARSYWSFFDPSSGEVVVGDQGFVATMVDDFYVKRYTNAVAYTFHQVVGLRE